VGFPLRPALTASMSHWDVVYPENQACRPAPNGGRVEHAMVYSGGSSVRMLLAFGITTSVLLIASCTAQPPVTEDEGTAAAGYGRLFGRIQFLHNGESRAFRMPFLESYYVTLLLRETGSDVVHFVESDSEGTLSWPLKPGQYDLVGLVAGRSAGSYHEQTTRRYMAPITIEAGTALYLGDIRVELRGGRYNITVLDQYDETLKLLQPRLASGKFRPVKARMQPERPPGNYKAVRPICDAAWGMPCSETNLGVEIVRPIGMGPFPTTESLTPLLEWRPSTQKDVTYDVAIYESLTFEFTSFFRMLGSQAAYAEGLTEPRFTPSIPLRPDKKYEWSVRLRRGDTVSSWSSTSFSLNLLIGARSNSGRYFGFETPAQ
jgi:hypothetical protein